MLKLSKIPNIQGILKYTQKNHSEQIEKWPLRNQNSCNVVLWCLIHNLNRSITVKVANYYPLYMTSVQYVLHSFFPTKLHFICIKLCYLIMNSYYIDPFISNTVFDPTIPSA